MEARIRLNTILLCGSQRGQKRNSSISCAFSVTKDFQFSNWNGIFSNSFLKNERGLFQKRNIPVHSNELGGCFVNWPGYHGVVPLVKRPPSCFEHECAGLLGQGQDCEFLSWCEPTIVKTTFLPSNNDRTIEISCDDTSVSFLHTLSCKSTRHLSKACGDHIVIEGKKYKIQWKNGSNVCSSIAHTHAWKSNWPWMVSSVKSQRWWDTSGWGLEDMPIDTALFPLSSKSFRKSKSYYQGRGLNPYALL